MVSYKLLLFLDPGISLFEFLSKEIVKWKEGEGGNILSNIIYFRKLEIEIPL